MRNNIRMLDKLVPDSGVPGFTVDKGDRQILLAPTINPCNPLEKSLKSCQTEYRDLPTGLKGFAKLELIGFANWIGHFFPRIAAGVSPN